MKDLLLKLLETSNKTLEINDKYFVSYVKLENNLDLIKLNLHKGNSEYKGIVMEKGLTFPIPSKYDIILAKKIYLKYNKLFQFQVYIEGKVINENDEIKIENIQNTFSFEQSDIFDTLSKISNIKIENSCSTIFIIESRLGNFATVKSLSDLKQYSLEFNLDHNKAVKDKSFLWINFHKLQNNKVIFNSLTSFEIMSDEQLAKILDLMCFKNLSIFKVVDINEDNIVVININYNIFNINKNSERLKKFNIECCALIIISNYKEENDEIKLSTKSFIYILKQELYYLDIHINSKAILKLYIKDFNEKGNKYNAIINCEGDEKIIISKNEEYLIINNIYPRIFEYFPFKIGLLNTKDEKDPMIFTIYVYNGLMNKLNVFLNTNCPKTYFYEYLYYNITQPLKDIEKKIIVNDLEYNIKAYDNFSSENRKRICLLNIPYQNIRTFEKELLHNSIQVNELILEDKREVLAINDICSVEIKKPQPCSYFNNYYLNFGDIYDLIMHFSIDQREKIVEVLNQKIELFNNLNFKYDLDEIYNFGDDLTLSQFKAYVGLIICHYMSFFGKESTRLRIFDQIVYIFISILDRNVKHYDFIRILIFLIKEKIINRNLSNVELIFVSDLDKFSPYLLAYQFNIKQITNLHEYHLLFQAYLQFDSFEAYNYIHKRKSYTFSLEMNFMIKHHLLSAYENFFIVEKVSRKEYAYLDHKTKITVVNETSIFNDNGKDINTIINIEDTKNCAIPMVLNFSHEKSGHYKFILKNSYESSPLIYFKGLRTELEIIFKDGYIDGETGNIIEKFICDDIDTINELSTNFIYGELLESKYFNGNENELKKAVQAKKDEYVKKTSGDPHFKTIKKIEKSNINKKILPEFSRFKYGCLKSDTNSRKKELPKEQKEEIDRANYMENIEKYRKMKEIYDNNKKLFEKNNQKK